jgi:hypothetical protein
MPMLDEDEWQQVSPHLMKSTQRALEIYFQITGLRETNINAVWHHRLSQFGPPCRACGKPLRTPRAKLCGQCGAPRDGGIVDVSLKVKINSTFVTLNGSHATRSKMEDFLTVRSRVFARIKAIDETAGNNSLIPGVNSYNHGDYEAALGHFMRSLAQVSSFETEIRPHIRICEKVIHTDPSPDDIKYRDAVSKWEQLPFFLKWFRKSPSLKLRCKHCGHFTTYIGPEDGFAYMGGNNCEICGRGYPMSDFAWDGIDGQAYIYYRHSVGEESFYREFEDSFDVEEDHRIFLASP